MSRSIWLQDPGIHRHLEIQFFTMKRTIFYVPHVTTQIHHCHRIIRYHKLGAIVRMPSMASSMKMSDPCDRLQATAGDRLRLLLPSASAALPQPCRNWPLASCTQSPTGSSPTSQSDHGLFLMRPDRCVATDQNLGHPESHGNRLVDWYLIGFDSSPFNAIFKSQIIYVKKALLQVMQVTSEIPAMKGRCQKLAKAMEKRKMLTTTTKKASQFQL